MKAFLVGCLAMVAIAVGAYYALEAVNYATPTAEPTEDVRRGE